MKITKLLAGVLALVLIAGLADTSFADSVQTDFPISVSCTPSSQLCDNLFLVSVETQSELKVKYTVSNGHCSSVRVNIFLDGNPVSTSQFLGWPGAPSPFDVLPLMTNIIDLGPVSPGIYQISLQGEGQVSGCNVGNLFGWAGTLTTFTESIEPQVVGGELLSIDNTALLLAGIQSSAIWMLPALGGIAVAGTYFVRTRMNKDN